MSPEPLTGQKSILLLCPHPENVAPGQRLKYEQYFDYLRDSGYSITVSPFMSEKMQSILYKNGFIFSKILGTIFGYFKRVYDLLRAPFYDGVFVFLYVTPFGPPFFELLLSIANKKLIYDIDDMVFLKEEHSVNRIATLLKGRTKMKFLIMKAKHVITCTPYLDDYARKFNHQTTDISSTINTDDYQPVNRYKNSADDPIVLGWTGSHSTSNYLKLLSDVLPKLADKYNIKLLVIGDKSFQMEGIVCEAHAWNLDNEVSDLQKIDIGLYPIPDDPWVYGKSGLKALQYMALGIPTVASAIGTNFRIIKSLENGVLVKTDEDWYSAIESLIRDCDLRRRLGEAGRRTVLKNYSVIANRDTYLSIFDSVYRSYH